MTPMDGESSNVITVFSVQHVYKCMQMPCAQSVHPLKIVLDLWTVVRPIARLDENHRVVYNGHKRVPALKFQSVALLNDIIA